MTGMNFYRQLHTDYHQLDYSAWYLVVGQHARIVLAENSIQGLIPVLGPVLRTRIKDLYYESFSFHKKIRPVSLVKSEFPGYNGFIHVLGDALPAFELKSI